MVISIVCYNTGAQYFGSVAQRLEHQAYTLAVEGSNPSRPTKYYRSKQTLTYFGVYGKNMQISVELAYESYYSHIKVSHAW